MKTIEDEKKSLHNKTDDLQCMIEVWICFPRRAASDLNYPLPLYEKKVEIYRIHDLIYNLYVCMYSSLSS